MSYRVFRTVTPSLVVKSSEDAIEFYKNAFGAEVREVQKGEDGKVMNAQIVIGDSVVMMNDEFPEWGVLAPAKDVPLPFTLHFRSYSIDADFQRAVDAGAVVSMPLDNMFWGDRYGQVVDPFGYRWSIGQPIDEL